MRIKVNGTKVTVADFISHGLVTATYIHIFHLNENDYNRHVILDEFYKALPELMDVFAEEWLADNSGVPLQVPAPMKTAESQIESVINCCMSVYNTLSPSLQSSADVIVTQCNQTLYKLRKLK